MRDPIRQPLGAWLPGSTETRWDEFDVSLVKLAQTYGFRPAEEGDDAGAQRWDSVAAKVRANHLVDLDDWTYLSTLADDALEHMNSLCAHGVMFVVDDGLVLMADEEDHR